MLKFVSVPDAPSSNRTPGVAAAQIELSDPGVLIAACDRCPLANLESFAPALTRTLGPAMRSGVNLDHNRYAFATHRDKMSCAAGGAGSKHIFRRNVFVQCVGASWRIIL
jgi:hypothetical protein